MNQRRMNFPRIACILCVTILSGAPGLRADEERTALVIGNQRYESSVGPLRNPVNDAKAVAKTLRGLGFCVIERYNLDRDQLLRALAEFRGTLHGAQVGLFYYAGHGLSIAGSNYLIPLKSGFSPVGADGVTLRLEAETRLFNAEQAVADMATAGAKCNIVILDACRTTRLPAGGRTRDAFARGGLAEMTPPAGSLIAFATDSGRTAYDGDTANGLYTEELLKYLASPGLTIEQVFKRTRAGVLKRSDGAQMPAEYSRLVGDDIYLAGEMRVAPAIAITSPTPQAARTNEQLLADATTAAGTGDAVVCIDALEELAKTRGPGDYAVAPLETLLGRVKDNLKASDAPSSRVVTDLATCDLVARAVPICLPKDDARSRDVLAKAHNRRGDCLMLLGRAREALQAYNTAMPLAPGDAYIVYNRGCANLALGDHEAAKADFKSASDPRSNQPGARKLAAAALANLE
jgi:uncharacterized caspase-like protein